MNLIERMLDRLGILADVILPSGRHLYLSTHCRHRHHRACAATTINAGPRRPAQCKTCDAPCRCVCHQAIPA